MPVRIYDIAKKLGIESKEVLVKAKELGIAGAKVPSSSLDKITAEYLEEQLGGKPVAVAEPPPAAPEPIVIVSAPPEPPAAAEPPADSPAVPPDVEHASPPQEVVEIKETPVELPLPSQPAVPPPPPAPRVGEKVGFIQLPQKPAPKIGAKVGAVKLPPKPVAPARPGRPGDRPVFAPPHAGKPETKAPAQPAAPAMPKFVAPATGEIITLKPPIVVR
ncbi:MAG TPA: translation initiation factor IF-2 N-terminal domain-containing protein, partial [Verrucomicrobiae bacterium]|nr:translation initiation factor IF-2 N-terminal domain-containing protein [Verrucomicrobiae bacterium]